MTVREALIASLTAARKTNDGQSRPTALLWTDEQKLWETVVPILQQNIPELLVFGPYRPERKQGPAAYLFPLIDHVLPELDWPEDRIPIVYFPGIGNKQLRTDESCPWELQPFAAMKYRAVTWQKQEGSEWTPRSFLSDNSTSVGWKLSRDEALVQALQDALPTLLDRDVEDMRGRTLTAQDFHHIIVADQYTEMLIWLEDSAAFKTAHSEQEWNAFKAMAKEAFKFDTEKRTAIDGVKSLMQALSNEWESVWRRFAASPSEYPAVIKNLGEQKPPAADDMFAKEERFPAVNERDEKDLLEQLRKLENESISVIRSSLYDLEKKHAHRCEWIWAGLGKSPLAQALLPLVELARATEKALPDSSYEALATAYESDGWKADAAFLESVSMKLESNLYPLIVSIAERLYRPWLESCALTFQQFVKIGLPYPFKRKTTQDEKETGECILFLDGLRLDVGRRLEEYLHSAGCTVSFSHRFAALPTVTENAKPACSPVAHLLSGSEQSSDFTPIVSESGRNLSTDMFRRLLSSIRLHLSFRDRDGRPYARRMDGERRYRLYRSQRRAVDAFASEARCNRTENPLTPVRRLEADSHRDGPRLDVPAVESAENGTITRTCRRPWRTMRPTCAR